MPSSMSERWSATAKSRPSPTPSTAPSSAIATDSSRSMVRSCRRLSPTARNNPISRTLSMTDRARVLTMPSTAMTTASPSRA